MNFKNKTLLMIRPLQTDGWTSMNRYCKDLQIALQREDLFKEIKMIDGLDQSSRFPQTINRRVRYPLRVRREVADIYHLVDQSYSNILHFLPRKKCVLTCHDLEFWRKKNSFNFVIRAHILSGLKKAAQIICVSGIIREELLTLIPELESRTSVIHNTVSDFFIEINHDEKTKLKVKRGLKDKIILLNVGTCSLKRKNIDFIFEVLKNINGKIPFTFIQVGGKFSSSQRDLIKNFNLEDSVRQFEKVTESELLEWYQCSDYFLMPSLYEGFGLPLLEAAACGLPLLFSDIQVFKELARGKLEPLVLDSHNWSDKIVKLSGAPKLRENLISTQLEWVSSFKSVEWAKKYIKIYEKIMDL
jgi:glycosyltransferase involved in cell wall biosynthesis